MKREAEGDSFFEFFTLSGKIHVEIQVSCCFRWYRFDVVVGVFVFVASCGCVLRFCVVVDFSASGDFASADQVITVKDVDLFAGVNFDDQFAVNSALQSLVDAGKLIAD